MTALELHRSDQALDLAPILRVIKYLGFDTNSLSEAEVEHILKLYRHFERDPELVVGSEAVSRKTGVEVASLSGILRKHRGQIPYLGTTSHPMVPAVAIGMIRRVAQGQAPLEPDEKGRRAKNFGNQPLFTLTEMAARTNISAASLSKYVKQHADRIPSRIIGRTRKFPSDAVSVFQQIKAENLRRRGYGGKVARRQRAAVTRRYAEKFAELERQVDAANVVARQLSRTLGQLSRQVRRARRAAEKGSKVADEARRSNLRRARGRRPDTIVAACKAVLEDAREPMRVADVTERVVASGVSMKAKNPNVTVSSILSSYDDFKRVRRGYYELVNVEPATTADSQDAGPEPADAAPETTAPGRSRGS